MGKPEALRLADAIKKAIRPEASLPLADWTRAASELLRLHELLEAEQTLHQRVIYPELQRLRAQRDALLEALKMLVLATKEVSVGRYNEEAHDIALSKARAAIKAVKENT